MASEPGVAPCWARLSACRTRLFCLLALALVAGWSGPARAEESPAAAMLDRLCAQTLRSNEEDRLFGMISITVRATIKYEGGVFSPDLIDDAIEDALAAMIEACPQFAAAASAQRLGMAVELVRNATSKRMQDTTAHYNEKQTDKATAADLSEELSLPEIDAWLDGLPARQRALALLLYASNVTPSEAADALGLSTDALATGFAAVKGDLLKFFREDWSSPPPPPIPPSPAMEYRQAGKPLGALLGPDPAPAAAARITGISSDIYAGWSLLASVTGLPAERDLDLDAPILLEPDSPGRKRMIVTAVEEIGDPHDNPRRFLLKAFAIDADREGAGLGDGFHLGAAIIDNPQAQQTLHNRSLAAIEIARCLWFDYGTAADPGLCH